ncbi:DUF928 domain-containing protein [Dendronalium sp. ChiSLP03b]|uniref:DUF928 domain-containing protein n=1 Tax=Dendronalium sp. ChiSLP03b TaxID=3075381 RepID=UPI002AD413D1|nr:DUF928 domain-containing protein [Dendronalium sp. ChiSLP03b]MDZ8208310.1 DUF928 domain-containing protein [Dendronalium sp. ChiSLP03b]
MFKFCLPTARWFKAIISTILAIALFISYPLPVLAQQDDRNFIQVFLEGVESVLKGRSQRKELKAPNGRPRGGAGRGRCPALISLDNNEIPLTAFVPTIQEPLSTSQVDIVWGRTIEAYPTFWFYIPYVYQDSEIEYGRFVLLNQQQQIVAGPIFVKIPDGNQPSIAKFTLPETVAALKEDQEYNWYFSILCNPLKPSRNPGVTGWIEKIKLPILPPKSSLYYAKQGIWYDVVTRLFQNQNSEIELQDRIDLIKYIFKDVIEKPQKEEKINEEELNKIANKIASLRIEELIPVPNPESP